MRMGLLALAMAVMTPAAALAGTDIGAACYKDCEAQTHSNPEYKACVARAADKADAALNQAYKAMRDKIRAAAKDMGQPADTHLEDLRASQKYWINFRDANCTLEDNLAFGGTAMGGNYSSCLCALSYERINDFERMAKDVMGAP
ncbi:lysozyme inhibitor LprI family protein [Methyloceanibacter sp.]|uniref:lysozyme inhibitor LprI family protein n=1 Tax=Methyloceanibacter sp. TaxID=1965321 RepID=UPI002D623391|nr:lysozyme inhibitor LprI family protein [Methyloceanibacter sp.]HZP09007.1 lysozyme inhibitor LprI family protein [Methyloceanibacter sp.]